MSLAVGESHGSGGSKVGAVREPPLPLIGERSVIRSRVVGGVGRSRASRKRPSTILPKKHDVSSYDLVVIGTPVWAWSLSSPVRAYLMATASQLPKVAFFCTLGARGSESAFAQMTAIVGKKPRAVCAITQREVLSANHVDRLTPVREGAGGKSSIVWREMMESATFRKWLGEQGCRFDTQHEGRGEGHGTLTIHREGRIAELSLVGRTTNSTPVRFAKCAKHSA